MSAHLIALALATVARLRYEFDRSSNPASQAVLLKTSADIIDCSVPTNYLLERIRHERPLNELAYLIEYRSELTLLLPTATKGKPTRRIRPSQWPKEHARFIRLVTNQLKSPLPNDSLSVDDGQQLWDWLQPAIGQYPVLRASLQTLTQGE
ncbi:MAG: hypothetical protein Q7S87_09155 [Agitococcus sp.]|nr:hypothetical protein [Agitococcus sp.]MDO9177069.1 hypothetical protein [Agitococcus sp.]